MEIFRLFNFLTLTQLKPLFSYLHGALFLPISPQPKVQNMEEWTRIDIDKFRARFEDLWSSYEDLFYSSGYTLWERRKSRSYEQVPPNKNPRAPDGFSYAMSTEADKPWVSTSTKLHAARTKDNRDVVIVLLSDGVRGISATRSLEIVGRGLNAALFNNHTLPVLEWLRQDNLVFGVFPMVGRWYDLPWFGSIGNILEFMGQIIEGVAFLHEHHIAHRDLFFSNFVSSWRSENEIPGGSDALFRTRYYIIDFEFAVCFAPDADPETRVVTGPPVSFDVYERPAPPEMRKTAPYCPFKADVWQLGCAFLETFGHIEDIPLVIELLMQMRNSDPAKRPTVQEALDTLNQFRSSISSDVIRVCVERPDEALIEEEDYGYRVV
ncbi:hypothetical protein CVT26_012428 [Gymnopilus dilepis]|uniref:Protein kinase domain-containing protein n=1 Tax=Gymnopilus dilepis TaxID=231916 RepID=A0A409YWB9_9AGAR|nr:hypothetical protein CVT26_012428 [Gymnopilus dilepis]